ncbi:DgyrCDS10149 [Dimorphilus gyrociliatus]|uniref:DgyrCDS10149 n=1 Tax=Dimorphilus gyrociliatus TaxID=2664684 RepID=A0A7I8VZ94_9ANNE|nr:DgyrCDS10149 [Dimorphilus gyrociliatus]
MLNVVDDLLFKVAYTGNNLVIAKSGIAAINVQLKKDIDSINLVIEKSMKTKNVKLIFNSKNFTSKGDYFFFKNPLISNKFERKLSILALSDSNLFKTHESFPIVSRIVKLKFSRETNQTELEHDEKDNDNDENIKIEAYIEVDKNKLDKISQKNKMPKRIRMINFKFKCSEYNHKEKRWKKLARAVLSDGKVKCTCKLNSYFAVQTSLKLKGNTEMENGSLLKVNHLKYLIQ